MIQVKRQSQFYYKKWLKENFPIDLSQHHIPERHTRIVQQVQDWFRRNGGIGTDIMFNNYTIRLDKHQDGLVIKVNNFDTLNLKLHGGKSC